MTLLEFAGGADEVCACVDTTSSYEAIRQTRSMFVYGESTRMMLRRIHNAV